MRDISAEGVESFWSGKKKKGTGQMRKKVLGVLVAGRYLRETRIGCDRVATGGTGNAAAPEAFNKTGKSMAPQMPEHFSP